MKRSNVAFIMTICSPSVRVGTIVFKSIFAKGRSLRSQSIHRRSCSSVSFRGVFPMQSRKATSGKASNHDNDGKLFQAIFMDYDLTMTSVWSVDDQLKAITNAMQLISPDAFQKREADLAQLVEEHNRRYKQLHEECLQIPVCRSKPCKEDRIMLQTGSHFDPDVLNRMKERISTFEKERTDIVIEKGVLKGFPKTTFLEASEQTKLHKRCLDVIQRCFQKQIKVGVLSSNWSENWIERSLCFHSDAVRWAIQNGKASFLTMANEIEYENDISTGNLIRKIETIQDKATYLENEMRSIQGLTLYIGDSPSDLAALLTADIGIVIGQSKIMCSFLEHYRIQTQEIKNVQFENHPFHEKAVDKDHPVLYRANDWDEIYAFLFDDDKVKSNVPRVLIVSGSDSGGGAGMQADLKACMATGSFGTTALTAITSQNTLGVQAIHSIPKEHIESQMQSVLSDLGTDVVKIGMLSSTETVDIVVDMLERYGPLPVVLDPVMVSTSGDRLSSSDVTSSMTQRLFPLATVVTPNLKEAEILTGVSIDSIEEMKAAAKKIFEMGPKVVLIKGGHLKSQSMAQDVVYDGHRMEILSHRWIDTQRLHGTGCTLASAIASGIAQKMSPMNAIRQAVVYVEQCLENSLLMELGHGRQLPMNHGHSWKKWPIRNCRNKEFDLSLYAITDADYNARHGRSFEEAILAALEGGITLLQVREKSNNVDAFLQSVLTALRLSPSIPVIVNDRVDVALATDADGVHIGQSDLPFHRLRALLGPERILGVSVKTKEEAIAAFQGGADYLGVGAIFPTKSKDSSVIGLDRLKEICSTVDIPVVAIGGIYEHNLTEVLSQGARGIAMISGIFDTDDIQKSTSRLIHRIRSSF